MRSFGKLARRTGYTVTTLFTALLAGNASAGGLWINEFGSPIMGRAGAGSLSSLEDASAALHNPASMTAVDGDQIMASIGLIATEAQFDLERSEPINGPGDGGDAGGTGPSGGVFYRRGLNDKWIFGLYAGGFTGAVLDFDDDWAGRFQAQEVNLLVVGTMPSLAYRVSERLSVGLALPILYSELKLDVALPGSGLTNARAEVDGDDTRAGYNLSAYYEISDATRIGVLYQSKFDFESGGNVVVKNFAGSPRLSSDTELPLVAYIKGSISHDFTPDFSGHVTVGWEEWSDLDSVILTAEDNTVELAKDWDDIWHVAFGIEYKLAPEWTLNLGYRFDQSPTYARDRTADLPVDEQKRYAIGFRYDRRKNFTMGAHLVYADLGDAQIDSSNSIQVPTPGPVVDTIEVPTGYRGDFSDNNAIFFSLSFNWKLGAANG